MKNKNGFKGFSNEVNPAETAWEMFEKTGGTIEEFKSLLVQRISALGGESMASYLTTHEFSEMFNDILPLYEVIIEKKTTLRRFIWLTFCDLGR